MNSRCLLAILFCALIACTLSANSFADDKQFTIVVGADAPELDRYAAEQLRAMLNRLSDGNSHTILIGNPITNPAIPKDSWPDVTDQGIVLKSTTYNGKPALIIGGGSPAATLWSVYEFGYRHGIRYLLREDIYPEKPVQLQLDNQNTVIEPNLRRRTWRTVNDFAIGPESWPLVDHKRFFQQLAKLKFNHLMLSVYPWQPFVHYEYQGIKKQTATLWFGEQYPIPRDAPGRTAFGSATKFENPDFAAKNSYSEMLEAGQAHVRGIIKEANRLGISVSLSISPLEFPKEFAAVLPGSKATRDINHLVVGPGKHQAYDDPTLIELVTAKIRAYLETYPDIDRIYLSMPEFPDWNENSQQAWKSLIPRLGNDAPEFEDLIKQVTDRNLIASGPRGVQSLKGNIVALAFFNSLLKDSQLLTRPDGKQVELAIRALDPVLFPYANKILPTGASTLNFIDYTARRVADNREQIARLPAGTGTRQLTMTLADDNVGILSQSTTRRLETLVSEIRKQGWDGFSTRYWLLAELDPAIHFLARSSWNADVTARSAHDDLFTTITGSQSVADRLWLAFGHIEQATELIDQHDLGFAFPVSGMLMKHYQAAPEPEWWAELNEQYTQAMIELYRSHDAAAPRSRPILYYWAKRSEYVLEYLSCLKSLRAAGIAKHSGDTEAAVEQLESAIEQLYNALDTLSDVVRDQGDRGLIAVLNAYAYRPLTVEYEKLLSEE